MSTTKDRFSKIQSKNQQYSDFLNDLTPHPITGDIVRFVNEQAVSRSLRNLILTNRGERLYQPEIGGDIYRMLFEPMSDGLADLLTSAIQRTIADYEPRAQILNVVVTPDYDNNLYTVIVEYMLINRSTPVVLNVTLTRVR
jgi:phage baseplate assembly protein W